MKNIWAFLSGQGRLKLTRHCRESSGNVFFRPVLIVCVVMLLLPGILFGGEKKEQKVVRVAYQKFNRLMMVDANNKPVSGYVFDYIQTIGIYSGWKIKYIPCNSFAECVRKLLSGEVELAYNVSYTEERAKKLLFPNEPMVYGYYYLYASENTSITPGDYSSMNGKKVGVTSGSIQPDLLKQWCRKRNVQLEIVEYENTSKKEADLYAGKIDLALEISMLAKQNFTAIEKVGSSAYYLVGLHGRQDLIDDINAATEKIQNNDLFYFSNLQERYFSNMALSHSLTVEEKKWLAGHKVLRVGYFNDYLPFSMKDENGNPIGAGIETIREIIRSLKLEGKLKVEFICFNDQKEGYKAVETGKVDLMIPAYISNSVTQDYRLIAGKSLATVTSILAYRDDHSADKLKRIGINRNNLMQYYYCRDAYPNTEIVFYDDIQGCLAGLLDGTQDGTFLNGFRSDALLKPGKYHSLRTVRAKNDFHLYMAFAENNIGLLLLMNRGLALLDPDFINNASYSYMGRIYNFSIIDYLQDHILLVIFAVAVIVAMIAALLVYWFSFRKLTRYNIQLEEEREKTIKAEKARSYFFSTVSHDIRTPLNTIVGFSEMLQMGINDEKEKREALDAIITSSKSLLDLTNDMLDFSKLESGKMEFYPVPTNLEKLVKGLTSPFEAVASMVSVQLRTEVGKMPILKLDPQRTLRILFNLVDNAVKFTKQGSVSVRVSFEQKSDTGKGTLRFEVEDTGCGIGEEDLKRITSPYAQVDSKEARHGGTGVGLAVCRKLVNAMEGELSIVSELGQGSTFTVTLRNVEVSDTAPEEGIAVAPAITIPKNTTAEPVPEVKEESSTASTARKRILIADDQKMNLMVLKSMLKKLGTFDVVMARDGQEALDILKSSDTPFHLVLTDMWMPVMDGEGLVRAIRADGKLAALPVLVVTADTEMQGKFRKVGFDGLLLKPVTVEMLKGILG